MSAPVGKEQPLSGYNIMPFVNNEANAMGNMYANLGLGNSTSRVMAQSGIQQAGATNQAQINDQVQQYNNSLYAQGDQQLMSGLGSIAGANAAGSAVG